jgi:hypothetical protein
MKLGSSDISAVKIGSTDVSKVYIGSTEVWSSFTGLLDTYTGAAAAYSLRQLRAAYTGDAIRVRRASDSTEQDIGFVNNVLDTASLTTFCSGTDGFVTTWYDQSGNARNAAQTAALNQPQIVSAGSILTLTGLGSSNPCIKLDGTNDFFNLSTSIPILTSDKYSILQVEKRVTSGSLGIYFAGSYGASPFTLWNYSDGNVYMNTKFNASTSNYGAKALTGNNYNLFTGYGKDDNANSNFYVNNSLNTFTSFSGEGRTTSFTRIGSRGAEFSGSQVQEMILYLTDQSLNNSGFQNNINGFYSIY